MPVKVSCGDIICVLNHFFNHVMLVSGEPFYMDGRDLGEELWGMVAFIPTLEISSEEQGNFSAWTILDCSLRRVGHFVGDTLMFPHDDNVYECEIWHAPFLFPATMEQVLCSMRDSHWEHSAAVMAWCRFACCCTESASIVPSTIWREPKICTSFVVECWQRAMIAAEDELQLEALLCLKPACLPVVLRSTVRAMNDTLGKPHLPYKPWYSGARISRGPTARV